MGLLYRVTVEYAGDGGDAAPSTVIVKLPVLIDATRQVALAYRFYEKEVAFYRELAGETSLRTPEVYFGAHDPTRTTSCSSCKTSVTSVLPIR